MRKDMLKVAIFSARYKKIFNFVMPKIDDMTNQEVIQSFITYLLAERRYSPLTVRNYQRDVDEFVAWGVAESGDFSLLEVRAEDLRTWIMHLSDERSPRRGTEPRRSNASINRTVASIRSMYKFLRREGIVERDLFASIRSLRTGTRLPKFVVEGDMVRVVERIDRDLRSEEWVERRNALMVLMLYACGLRLAELIAVRIGDFEGDYSSLRVRGKGDKERQLPIVARLRREIKQYVSSQFSEQNICILPQNVLFLSRRGTPISRSDVQRSVARLLRECGVEGKASPHVLRHTFATHLLNEGADVREIQELLGHSSLRATQVYTHNNIAQLQRAYFSAHPREGAK